MVSVIERELDPADYAPYQHLIIKLEDDPNENLLEHFPETNVFISEGLGGKGGVFVHW